MKLVFASDSFKGTLTSGRIGELLEQAAREAFSSAECVSLRISDGGEGMLDAIAAARPCKPLSLYVHDALMRPLRSRVLMSGGEAFVEAASTCGLAQLEAHERNPLATTSYGVGECISHALFHGCKRIYVGLGGTSTNDGGMGCLRALGMRFLDSDGRELAGCGADLTRVASIDNGSLFPALRDVQVVIMCDVTNPLLGPEGATRVFAPQKGAGSEEVERLEAGMRVFADAVSGVRPSADFETPGFGAAGGLGMALSVFAGGQIRSGVETVMQIADFDSALAGADLVVTGEGRLDRQTLAGKGISGVAAHARRAGVPVAAICGSCTLDDAQLRELGIEHVAETSSVQGESFALAHPEDAFLSAARGLFERIR